MSKDMFKVPGGVIAVDTPSTETIAQIFGLPFVYEGNGFTDSQRDRLWAFYGFKTNYYDGFAESVHTAAVTRYKEDLRNWSALSRKNRREPTKPSFGETLEDVKRFGETGDGITLGRLIARDGMRVMAFLSQYLEQGEDPVRVVARLAQQVGWDVTCDPGWTEYGGEQ